MSRSIARVGLAPLYLLATLGCTAPVPPPTAAPAAAPAEPPASGQPNTPAPEPAPEPTPTDASTQAAPTPAPEVSAAPEPVPAASAVADSCNALCEQAAKECSSRSARKCRANCERYQTIADRCGNEVLAALECQASVPGLICSNVVGECARDFLALENCEKGGDSKAKSEPARVSLPAGWSELKDTETGFSVGFPSVVPATLEAGHRTYRADDAGGVSYLVSVLPPFKGEVNDKSLVRKVLEIVGNDCQKGLKIHGRFEVLGKQGVRFDTVCRGGNAWHGMLRISEAHVIMTAEIVPPGKTGQGDAFYFSFSYLE